MKNDCSKFEILISAAIDGELEPSEFAELDAHVDSCEQCRLEYLKLETVNDMLMMHDLDSSRLADFQSDHSKKSLVETSGRSTFESLLPMNGVPPKAQPVRHRSEQSSQSRGMNGSRKLFAGGFLAATAAGLAALMSTPKMEKQTVEPFKVSRVALPAERVSDLNQDSLDLQDSQTLAMEREIRLLRLMIESSKLDPKKHELMQEKLELISRKLDELKRPGVRP